MKTLMELKSQLVSERPVEWDSLPDIGLYMDQVLSYMPRQQLFGEVSTPLTSSMINNYIKEGLLPHANGKKYSKEHLAHLTAISHLKQVLPVRDTGFLLALAMENLEIQAFYDQYRRELNDSLSDVAAKLPACEDAAGVVTAALKFALEGYANQIACEYLLEHLRETSADLREKPAGKIKEKPTKKGKPVNG